MCAAMFLVAHGSAHSSQLQCDSSELLELSSLGDTCLQQISLRLPCITCHCRRTRAQAARIIKSTPRSIITCRTPTLMCIIVQFSGQSRQLRISKTFRITISEMVPLDLRVACSIKQNCSRCLYGLNWPIEGPNLNVVRHGIGLGR